MGVQAATAGTSTATLAARLDRLPLSRFHWKILLLSGLGWMFDAMDILIIASVAAAASREWAGAAPEAAAQRNAIVAMVTAANTAGLFFGALISGWLADRIGRKAVFQVTLLIYSVFTGLAAFAPSPETLAVLRFVAGLGLGGELPVAAALVSEFAPARRRGFLVVLLESFWAYGAVLAALVGFVVIGKLGWGWRAAMLMGALPAFYVMVVRRSLPESPRLLASQGRLAEAEAVVRDAERQSGLAEVAPPPVAATPAAADMAAPPASARARVATLFGPVYFSRTLVLWAMWATMNFSYYGIFLWLPAQFVSKGFSLDDALTFNLVIAVAQIPGYFAAAWLVERWGRKWTLASFLLLAAVGAYFFGQVALAARDVPSILFWGSVISFFNLGAWGVVYTYTPELYPTWLRATGAGWAAAFGRIFAFLAPLSVPFLVGLTGAPEAAFVAFMAVMVAGGLLVLAVGPETRGRSLEEVAGA